LGALATLTAAGTSWLKGAPGDRQAGSPASNFHVEVFRVLQECSNFHVEVNAQRFPETQKGPRHEGGGHTPAGQEGMTYSST
jgi:hypothetical protein